MRKPNERQKKLATLTVKAMLDDTKKTTKAQLLKEAGYSEKQIEQRNAYENFKTEGYNTAMIEALETVDIDDKLIGLKIKELLNNDNYNAIDKGIGHVLKIKGSYAPTKTEHKEDVDIQHTINQDSGDYLAFIKQQNKDKQIINGEEVNEGN